ncbi:MAG TPA: hypothetical protein VM680_05350 [Verrucomicrobiae bacterium]|nr:hypothetical protein [Verrucomicrobiae bacterium]
MTNDLFPLVHDLSDIVGHQKIISASIGPHGEACLLLTAPENEAIAYGRKEQKGFASFPLSIARKYFPATFIRYDGNLLQQTPIAAVQQAFPSVQPLTNQEILIIGARCDFRNGKPEKNATVFDGAGNALRQFVLGDGIQDVQTTKDGMIWVSYFDEGIFGNYGWSEPIGAPGLVCFDATGRKLWEFKAPEGFDAMADCYAMNVADDSVWACYYTDFPVVNIDAQRNVRAWANEFAGATAMAVDERRVVLWGGYGEEGSRCVSQNFGDRKLEKAKKVPLRFPAGVEAKNVRLIGRGSALHLFDGCRWYVWKLQEL